MRFKKQKYLLFTFYIYRRLFNEPIAYLASKAKFENKISKRNPIIMYSLFLDSFFLTN